MNRKMKRMALPIGAALILGSSGFAFMAANSMSPSSAGTGTSIVSGYVVSPIHFNTTPAYGGDAYVKSIEFSLNKSADPVNVGAYIYDNYQGDASRFTNCTSTNASNTAFECKHTNPNYGNTTADNGASVTVGSVEKVVVTAAQ